MKKVFLASEEETNQMETRYESLAKQIGIRLKTALANKGMNQNDFAKKLGKSASEISLIVKGRRNVTLETIATFETILEENLVM